MSFWWLDPSPSARWSPEERRVRMAIYGIAIPIFFTFFGIEAWMFNHLGIDKHLGALIIALTGFPGSIYVSRQICVRSWPELMNRADENAARRLTKRDER